MNFLELVVKRISSSFLLTAIVFFSFSIAAALLIAGGFDEKKVLWAACFGIAFVTLLTALLPSAFQERLKNFDVLGAKAEAQFELSSWEGTSAILAQARSSLERYQTTSSVYPRSAAVFAAGTMLIHKQLAMKAVEVKKIEVDSTQYEEALELAHG